jgi:hypothetical protein
VNKSREVTVKHGWIYAGTMVEGAYRCLVVRRSIRTERGGLRCMRPVESFLDVFCHIQPVPPEVVEDVTMMGGQAINEFYIWFAVCPGEAEHACRATVSTAVISA